MQFKLVSPGAGLIALALCAPVASASTIEYTDIAAFDAAVSGPATYNFEPADSLVAFSQSHRMAVRGHTLVWHQQLPSWLTSGGYSFVGLSSILADHIYTVMKHFAGQVYAWDVVNEAFNDDGSLRGTLWSNAPGIGREGTAYIEQALRWAHAADPKALLFYNDFGAEPVNAKSDAIYRMARDFLSRGVPLNGIGLQMHLSVGPAAARQNRGKSYASGRAWPSGADHRIGRQPACRCRGEGCSSRYRPTGRNLWRRRCALFEAPSLHSDSDLGIHRQILLDSFLLSRQRSCIGV